MKKYDVLGEVLKFGVMASVITLALPELSFAAATATDTLGSMMTNTASTQVRPAATLINTLAFVGGAVLIVSGALSLKKHADNPASEPMGKGLTRLIVGGGIMSLPYLANTLQNTLFSGGKTTATYSDFTGFSPATTTP